MCPLTPSLSLRSSVSFLFFLFLASMTIELSSPSNVGWGCCWFGCVDVLGLLRMGETTEREWSFVEFEVDDDVGSDVGLRVIFGL